MSPDEEFEDDEGIEDENTRLLRISFSAMAISNLNISD
jgi:hypothetical protein